MKIVVLDGYAANPGDLSWENLQTLGDCTIYDRTREEEVIERAKDAEIILTNKTVVSAATIQALPNLKYIGVIATGYNIVDINAARERGIVVTNIPAYSTNSVAQLVFAHLLNICHHVEHHSEEVRNGLWSKSRDFCFWDTPLIELHGKKIGIIGLGNIGQQVARISLGFGLDVCAYTSKSHFQLPPEVTKMELEQLFSECDIISLHCPLTEDTRHLINAHTLSLMKSSAVVINTGRGDLVDEQALADALNNGKIYAAGLDVLSTEPPMADNPLLSARNCFITPHIAWASREARTRLLTILVENIQAFQAGKPINNVAK